MLAVFALVNLALVRLKRRRSRLAGVVPCPAWIPVAGAGTSIGLLVAGLVGL